MANLGNEPIRNARDLKCFEAEMSLEERLPERSVLDVFISRPVWAVKPWFGISFHCAHISSVFGVVLYPISNGLARHA